MSRLAYANMPEHMLQRLCARHGVFYYENHGHGIYEGFPGNLDNLEWWFDASAVDDVSWLDLPGTSGAYASVPDAASLDVTGDIDIQAKVACDSWTVNFPIVSKRGAASRGVYEFRVLATSGKLRLGWLGTNAPGIDADSTVAPTVAAGETLWVRVTKDDNNGSGQYEVKFYTGGSGDTPTWVQLGATVTGTTDTALANALEVSIGTLHSSLAGGPGRIFAAVIKNGIDGTTVLDADFTSRTPGATSFSTPGGHTVTVNGTAKIAPVATVHLEGFGTGVGAKSATSLPTPSTSLEIIAAYSGPQNTATVGSHVVGENESSQRSWTLVTEYGGNTRPNMLLDSDGGSPSSVRAAPASALWLDNKPQWVKVVWSSAGTLDWYSALWTGDTSLPSSWTHVGQTTGVETSLAAQSQQTRIGQFVGDTYRVVVTIDGTLALDADFTAQADGTTSFTDSTGNHTVTLNTNARITGEGDALRAWNDSSGNKRTAVQATAANRPLFVAKAVGGKPALRFDGTNDSLATAAISALSQPNTVIVVAKSDDPDTNTRFMTDGLGASNRHAVFTSGGSFSAHSGLSIVAGTDDALWHVFAANFNTTSSAMYVDGGAAAASGDAGSHTLTGLRVGALNNGSASFWDGDIAEVIVYSDALTNTELNRVGRYLASKYGTTWTDI